MYETSSFADEERKSIFFFVFLEVLFDKRTKFPILVSFWLVGWLVGWLVTCLLMVFNVTFKNILTISWRSVLLVEETGRSVENHRHVASHWLLSHNAVSSTTRLSGIWTQNNRGDGHWLHQCPGLGQAQQYTWVKHVTGIPTTSLIIGSPTPILVLWNLFTVFHKSKRSEKCEDAKEVFRRGIQKG